MMFSKKVLAMVFASSLFMSAASAAVVETPAGNLEKTPEISVMLPGFARDNGFMEAGYRGYTRIANEVTTNVKCVSEISATSNREVLTEELRKIAQEGPKLIIAHGGCNH